jgi:hypothetical protein
MVPKTNATIIDTRQHQHNTNAWTEVLTLKRPNDQTTKDYSSRGPDADVDIPTNKKTNVAVHSPGGSAYVSHTTLPEVENGSS